MKAILTFVFALWTCTAAAQPWIPTECPQRPEAKWAEFVRHMRQAKPGSPIFAPKPYPTADAQVIEDFEYAYAFMWKGAREVREEELPLFQAVKSKSVRYKIRRVENWTPTRCDHEQQYDQYILLDIYGTVSGKHLARASLMQSGLLAGWFLVLSPTQAKLLAGQDLTLEEAVRQVRDNFGVNASSPQYVVSWGTVRCTEGTPCVAFRSAGRVYLLQRGELLEFSAASKVRRDGEITRSLGDLPRSELGEDERLLSIGRDHWVVARKVPSRR